MISIDLPWPSQVLHPNARPHWAKRARAAKAARLSAAWAASAVIKRPVAANALSLTISFTPPDNRRRDLDGMLSNIKPYLDGIADVVGIDDSKWQIKIRREAAKPAGNVHIEIEAADTWEHISEPLGRVIAAIPDPKWDAA